MFKSTSTSLILLGVLGVIVGIVAIAWPGVTILALVILFAVFAFIRAGLQAMRAFSSATAGPVFGRLLLALIDLAATSARAAEVLDETAMYLGVSIGNLINMFNPERIIIGGWAGLLLGERLLPAIREAAREHSLHYPFGQTSIELGRLGPNAVALGAATLPVEALLSGTRFAATKSDRPAS